jgi:predicted dienelactone hydrolase
LVTGAAIGTGGFLGFAMIRNTVLRIAITGPARPARLRRAARAAVIAGALAIPASAVLREAIWTALGTGGQVATATELAAVTATGALAIAVLTFGIALAYSRPSGRRAHPRWRAWASGTLRTFGVFALAVAVLSGGYVALAAVRRAQPLTLPAPTGPYHVGRTAFDWTDPTRTDPLGPGIGRELSVWLWYPAAPQATGRPAPYAPGAWEQLHFPGLPGLGQTSFDAIRVHALENVPVAEGRFPIAVLEPGLGLAAPQYTTLAENLASHGYLVAGVTPTYSANLTVLHGRPVPATTAGNPPAFDSADPAQAARAADRLVAVWAADARFAASQTAGLDRTGLFAQHIDQAHTAYLGHSLGGAAALEACRTDPRCAGAADLDGAQYGPVAHTGLRKPMMIIGSQNSCVTGVCQPPDPINLAERDIARALLSASTGPAFRYQIDGSRHFDFSDFAAYYLATPLRALLPLGTIDGDTGLDITNAYLTAFLDHTVHGTPEPLLTRNPSPYHQVRLVQ